MRITRNLTFALLILAIASFATHEAPAASPFGDWRLRSMEVRGKKIPLIPGSRITLNLQRSDRCSGRASVNSYFGECLITESLRRIQFPSGLGTTLVGGPPNLMRQESRYRKNLTRSKRYRLRKGRLLLISGNKRIELSFRRIR